MAGYIKENEELKNYYMIDGQTALAPEYVGDPGIQEIPEQHRAASDEEDAKSVVRIENTATYKLVESTLAQRKAVVFTIALIVVAMLLGGAVVIREASIFQMSKDVRNLSKKNAQAKAKLVLLANEAAGETSQRSAKDIADANLMMKFTDADTIKIDMKDSDFTRVYYNESAEDVKLQTNLKEKVIYFLGITENSKTEA